jgi:glycosyltransferase involved in cell wall biosynthesis
VERTADPTVAADGGRPLRIALTSYRSKPHCGGQGVYVRALSRELVALGHEVEVLSGQPYPELDGDADGRGPRLTRVPSLDLYRDGDPFRTPHPRELRGPLDLLELALMWTAAFPEPLTFSLRVARLLRDRPDRPDLVHDNQTLGYGLLLLQRAGLHVVATVHHPITEDRRHDLAAARRLKKISTRRWYSFLRMQGRVVRRLPALLTVSGNSRADIARDFRVPLDRLTVVPVGVATDVFRPPRLRGCPGGSSPPPAPTCRSRAWCPCWRRSPSCGPSATSSWWWSADRSRAVRPWTRSSGWDWRTLSASCTA